MKQAMTILFSWLVLMGALTLSACATKEQPQPMPDVQPTVEQVPPSEALQRLIRDTVAVDQAKRHVESMPAQKPAPWMPVVPDGNAGPMIHPKKPPLNKQPPPVGGNPAFGARELGLVVQMADESVQSARNNLLAGDMEAFERAMVAVQEFLKEFHGRVNRSREEAKMQAEERRVNRQKR